MQRNIASCIAPMDGTQFCRCKEVVDYDSHGARAGAGNGAIVQGTIVQE